MRNFAIFGGLGATGREPDRAIVEIDDCPVRSGIVETAPPVFDPDDPDNAYRALVRVSAFSCNFRDKGFILQMQGAPAYRFFAIGSELVATVLETGPSVSTLRAGDRVVGQNHYTLTGNGNGDGAREGVVTNQASKEIQVLPASKLVPIPDEMPDEVAAGFSLCAQTAYSMVRKIDPQPGERVLVTSATSNTSLSVLSALRTREARVFASTRSSAFDDRLLELGAERILHVPGAASFRDSDAADELSREIHGFDAVIDPFFDLHVEKAVQVLAPSGRYVTCGLAAQNPGSARRAGVRPINGESIFFGAMVKNLSLMGNCLGLADDLHDALQDYQRGRLECTVDSVHSGTDTAAFLDRTYNDRGRLGKVIFRYGPE